MKKRVTWGGVLILLLVSLVGFGLIINWTNGLQEFDMSRPLNEDNLYSADLLELKSGNPGDGVAFNVNDNGSFKVKGKADANVSYKIADITLDQGTYTITALEGASKGGACVEIDMLGSTYHADFTDNTIIVVEDDTTITLTLKISEGTEINATIYPVIVEGNEAADYFA